MTKLIRAPEDSNWLEANVSLDGHQVVAMFDTGSALSAATTQAVQRTGIKAEAPPVTATAGIGLANKCIDAATAVFSALSIGQESDENAKLRIADLFGKNTETHLEFLYSVDNPDLIIGADFFMAHRIYVARSQGKINFTYKGGPMFQYINPNTTAPSGETGAGGPKPR